MQTQPRSDSDSKLRAARESLRASVERIDHATRNEQASAVLDGLERIETVPITMGITTSGEIFARNLSHCAVGTSYRDALAKLIQLEITK